MRENETLQQQCGTESGIVQVQFALQSLDTGYRIDIFDVLKPNDVNDPHG